MALQGLPIEQREIVVARLWGGLNFEQIAEVAGCSVSTAFRRFSAGIDALRKELGELCPNPCPND
jgi:RNA polymerase sigma-70 factor (ECF subfamily)